LLLQVGESVIRITPAWCASSAHVSDDVRVLDLGLLRGLPRDAVARLLEALVEQLEWPATPGAARPEPARRLWDAVVA
jgi:hypothetical protein